MNEITVYDKIKSMPEIQQFGKSIALSGMFGCNREEQGVVFAIQCMHERKPPLEMAKTYHVVGDKLVKRSDAMLADFRRAGGKWHWKDLNSTDIQEAKVEWEDREYDVSYTIEQAETAGLVRDGSNWKKDPSTMLRARCVSRTLRAIAPEIVQGVYTEEDLDRLPQSPSPSAEPKNVTPEKAQESLDKQAAKAKADDPFKKAEPVEAEKVEEAEAEIDYSIIPIGANKGKRWIDLDNDTLKKVIENPRTLSEGHIAAAKDALENTPF